MLINVIRRLLWSLPTLVGITVLSFWFLSYVPDLTDDPEYRKAFTQDEITGKRRERFLDLPRFFNFSPKDVRTRAALAVSDIAEHPDDSEASERELLRLGGAALPYVLPALDTLSPEPRKRVALALAPLAVRMGIATPANAYDPDKSVTLWTRFWDDRGVEFRSAQVRSAINRLVRYRTPSRAEELRELDTFVLDPVQDALQLPTTESEVEQARALVALMAHVTGRNDIIAQGDSVESARATVERWRRFWSVYRSDFVPISGLSRITAVLLETRYGKWALGAISHGFGLSARGEPILAELGRRAPITLILLFGSIALAYGLALPLGTLGAASRGRKADAFLSLIIFAFYSLPTAALAALTAYFIPADNTVQLIAAIFVLSLGLIAAPTRQLRSMIASAMVSDYSRAAMARGASRLRVLIAHGLRNSMIPFVTLASLEPPLALSGAFVVERVFGLPGLGEAMIHAVRERDTDWLMAFSILAALTAALLVIATDLAYGVLDPRLHTGLLQQKERR